MGEQVRRGNGGGRNGNGTSEAETGAARRMLDRLDESGAPVIGNEGGEVRRGSASVEQEARIQEEIRVKAYERYVRRGGRAGSAEEDWREAEREVRGRLWSRGSGTEPGI